ncbi:hypothetical protein ABZ864_36930 [Streptomyces sp. NPDC047082]|uniref:hypothetical protein n=1 Tax=Streptomyces sp. NPDC047082 TaxID=3155259 RepID=UPI0033F49E03
MAAEQDLYVAAGDVPEFQREVALLRSRLDEVAHGTERPGTAEPAAVRGAGGSGVGRLTCGDDRWPGRGRR